MNIKLAKHEVYIDFYRFP